MLKPSVAPSGVPSFDISFLTHHDLLENQVFQELERRARRQEEALAASEQKLTRITAQYKTLK
jgi:hypothetical protein